MSDFPTETEQSSVKIVVIIFPYTVVKDPIGRGGAQGVSQGYGSDRI